MKFNLLYLIIPIAVLGAWFIVRDLKGQGEFAFFGTAETDPYNLNLESDIVIRKLNVSAGVYVEKGDTLVIAYQRKLDEDSLSYIESTRLNQVQLHQKQIEFLREKQLLNSQLQLELGKIDSDIRNLLINDSIDTHYRKLLNPESKNVSNIEQEKISNLKNQATNLRIVYLQKLSLIDAEINALKEYTSAKNIYSTQNYKFNRSFEKDLYIRSPIDGYVDQISIHEYSAVQAYKDLMRINPKSPNRIIGFIHENSNVNFQIGDSVKVQSSVRPDLLTQGIITSVSPRLVELPLRLRKFVEVRAWGREVFIQMNPNPGYYVGEKLSIALNVIK